MRVIRLSRDLPKLEIPSIDDLAARLGVTLAKLLRVSRTASRHYRRFSLPKRSGGCRWIDEPLEPVLGLQRAMHARLLAPLPLSPVAHGGVPGHSQLTAAALHVRKACVASVDAKDCFGSVGRQQVAALFAAMGCAPEVASILSKLLTRRALGARGRSLLPQGAPTSVAVVNLLLFDLDNRLKQEAELRGVAITRLIDSYEISGDDRCAVEALMAMVIKGFRQIGLRPNRKKVRLTPRHRPQRVGGLNVNNGLSIPKRRHNRRTAAGEIERDRTFNRKDVRASVRAAAHRGTLAEERNRLAGMTGYAGRLHPTFGKRSRLYVRNAIRRSDAARAGRGGEEGADESPAQEQSGAGQSRRETSDILPQKAVSPDTVLCWRPARDPIGSERRRDRAAAARRGDSRRSQRQSRAAQDVTL